MKSKTGFTDLSDVFTVQHLKVLALPCETSPYRVSASPIPIFMYNIICLVYSPFLRGRGNIVTLNTFPHNTSGRFKNRQKKGERLKLCNDEFNMADLFISLVMKYFRAKSISKLEPFL